MVLLSGLDNLIARLRDDGYRVIGPTVRDAAVVLDEIHAADQLPSGWGVDAAPGRYRLRRRSDRSAFATSAGPQSWKRFLHPPRSLLWTGERSADGSVSVTEPADDGVRLALVGVRPCDLRALGVQRRVFGPGSAYAKRLNDAFIVAVNCTEPSEVCFCVSAGGGPRAGEDADLILTELTEPGAVRYVAEAASAAGSAILDSLPHSDAPADDVLLAHDRIAAAERRMTRPDARSLPDTNLPAMLARAVASPQWEDVASRCLTCGNCTLVCPTCFCTSVVDTTDVTGDHAERWSHWASCFDIDYSEMHGGAARTSAASRYRQWLTHKFGTWTAQFGESGCVGCGRCIAWCPAGIDVTAELTALAATSAIEPEAAR